MLALVVSAMFGLQWVVPDAPLPDLSANVPPRVKRRMETPPTAQVQRERLIRLVGTSPAVAHYVLQGDSPDEELRCLAEETLQRLTPPQQDVAEF